ncbi:MAG TPA: hypothetical protein VKB95_03290 [Chitinophagaceae bacterium]|nr:hypothetical protein [Chitinophagaceae bacterium]
MQKLFSYNFAVMFFKRNHNNKAISTALLVLLLFIHSIKLLHTHSSDTFLSNDSRHGGFNDNSNVVKPSSDCSICSYQLSKDADDLVYPSFCNPVIDQIDFSTRLISFHKFSFPSVLENRGPPAIMV